MSLYWSVEIWNEFISRPGGVCDHCREDWVTLLLEAQSRMRTQKKQVSESKKRSVNTVNNSFKKTRYTKIILTPTVEFHLLVVDKMSQLVRHTEAGPPGFGGFLFLSPTNTGESLYCGFMIDRVHHTLLTLYMYLISQNVWWCKCRELVRSSMKPQMSAPVTVRLCEIL